ncbi:MAG: WHG domain-containing protein [Acidimicrobiales bacterium]|nr:WHG domain-containing protein [Acidimicrobiales bacterium]
MPRAGLTPALVVGEAALVADDVGYDHLTLAAVAQRLGVRLPSLYKHVDGLDALHRGLAVQATGELAAALSAAAVGRATGDALAAMANAYRTYATEHPGRYAATVRAPDPADAEHVTASDAVLVVVLAVLAGYGLRGDDAIDATRALRSALHGFVALEAAGGFGLPQAVDRSFARLVATFDAAFVSWA